VHDRCRIETQLVRGEQDARAEALDLETACGLRVEAVPEPARREDRERQHDESRNRNEDAERAQRLPAAGDGPDVDRRERHDDQRVELRRDREPEEPEPEQVAPAHEGCERAHGERGREEVVRVEGDRPHGDRGHGEQRGRRVQTMLRRTERHEREQDTEQRSEPAHGHERLECGVVGPAGQHSRRKEHRKRSRRVLDEDIAIREVAA